MNRSHGHGPISCPVQYRWVSYVSRCCRRVPPQSITSGQIHTVPMGIQLQALSFQAPPVSVLTLTAPQNKIFGTWITFLGILGLTYTYLGETTSRALQNAVDSDDGQDLDADHFNAVKPEISIWQGTRQCKVVTKVQPRLELMLSMYTTKRLWRFPNLTRRGQQFGLFCRLQNITILLGESANGLI